MTMSMTMALSPEEEQEIAAGRPTKFKPDWPPSGSSQTPQPKLFSKCSESKRMHIPMRQFYVRLINCFPKK